MKTVTGILIVMCAVVILGYGLAGAQEVNYSGNWTLDKAKSTLQGRMSESLVSLTLVITQKANDLQAEFQYKYQERDMTDKVALTIGGEQVEREVMNGRGKAKSKAQLSEDKKNLIISTDRTFTGQDGGTFTSKVTEKYSLSADGKTLTINQESVSERGTRSSTLVFTMQK